MCDGVAELHHLATTKRMHPSEQSTKHKEGLWKKKGCQVPTSSEDETQITLWWRFIHALSSFISSLDLIVALSSVRTPVIEIE